MPEVISSFRSLRAGSQVFSLLMLFLCVILHTMSSGNSLQLICILRRWYVRDVLYAVLYVRVSCFVVRGCGVSRRYIDV